jgi:hypothetical protein
MTDLRLRPVPDRQGRKAKNPSTGRDLAQPPGHTAAFTVVGVLSALVLATWLAVSYRGLDRVDESFILAYIANPDASRDAGEVSASGFVLHPLFLLAGRDIGTFRLLGCLLVAGLAALVADECMRCVDLWRPVRSSMTMRGLVAISAAATSVTAFTFGYRSLSYVSLTLCGLLITALGVCRALRGSSVVAGVLLAVGWWFTFSGKPTSAAALGLAVVVVLAWTGLFRWRLVLAGAGALTTATALTLVLMRMSLSDLVVFLGGGLHQEQLLLGHDNVWQMLGIASQPYLGFVIVGVPLLLVAATAIETVMRTSSGYGLGSALGLVLGTGLLLAVFVLPDITERGFGLQVYPATLVILLVGAWSIARSRRVAESRLEVDGHRQKQLLALLVLLAVLPYVLAVGSNSPFAEAMPKASVFWLLAGVVGTRYWLRSSADADKAQRLTAVTAGMAICVTGLLTVAAVTDGGGDRSLLAADHPVRLQEGQLLLPREEAELAEHLNAVAASGGLAPTLPVVDLTGVSPGYALQLGGTRLGREFFMGIFPGAPDVAAYAVSKASCEARERAWVLWAPENPWDVSGKVDLNGRRIPEDYEALMAFSPVQGPQAWQSLRIQVLRPRPGQLSCP